MVVGRGNDHIIRRHAVHDGHSQVLPHTGAHRNEREERRERKREKEKERKREKEIEKNEEREHVRRMADRHVD